ncbi:unnamed protein product [Phyllotreta striolata]|uniref:Uncharacterized protein n=1 Tax=Phyllotreta striolata TaxID=444603 RepID=A0A9N9TSY5_PHYSR|nr:unnamed protein product [Phyllotreta striolata]
MCVCSEIGGVCKEYSHDARNRFILVKSTPIRPWGRRLRRDDATEKNPLTRYRTGVSNDTDVDGFARC